MQGLRAIRRVSVLAGVGDDSRVDKRDGGEVHSLLPLEELNCIQVTVRERPYREKLSSWA